LFKILEQLSTSEIELIYCSDIVLSKMLIPFQLSRTRQRVWNWEKFFIGCVVMGEEAKNNCMGKEALFINLAFEGLAVNT
jgi:hypothetical protein